MEAPTPSQGQASALQAPIGKAQGLTAVVVLGPVMYDTPKTVRERSNTVMKVDTNNEIALQNVVEHLRQYDTMILATAEDGQPWTAGVFVAHEITPNGKLILY